MKPHRSASLKAMQSACYAMPVVFVLSTVFGWLGVHPVVSLSAYIVIGLYLYALSRRGRRFENEAELKSATTLIKISSPGWLALIAAELIWAIVLDLGDGRHGVIALPALTWYWGLAMLSYARAAT